MPGLDSFTKLMLHCNGVDGSTTFTDDSASAHTITSNGNAQIDTGLSKFGGASGLFDGAGDYLFLPDSNDWDFGSGDFTIDFWVNLSSLTENILVSININSPLGSYGYSAIHLGTHTGGSFGLWASTNGASWNIATNYNLGTNLSISTGGWHHVALIRDGDNLYLYVDGVQGDSPLNIPGTSFYSGSLGSLIATQAGETGSGINGSFDEIRISKGVARWTTTFTPPIVEYNDNNAIDEIENIELSDSIDVMGLIRVEQSDSIELSDNLQTVGLIQEEQQETIVISDSINQVLSIIYKYNTKLNTLVQKTYKYLTDLRIGIAPTYKYNTKLNTSISKNNIYSTDLRVRKQIYASITIGSLNDYVVKLDGVELTDVDYDSLSLSYNFNSNPSRAEFTLARRFDNLDQKLDNSASVITNENKIEIFDGAIKLFTGYIMEISPDSSTDTVKVIAEDCRSKMKNFSIELKYGGQFEQDEDDETKFTKFEKNIQTAYAEIMSAIGGLVSGYDNLPFAGSFVPEYTEAYNDYSSLLDDVILNTANVNWYIDENERLRFQKVGQGEIKTLNVSSLTEKRHPYDLILSDVNLNKRKQSYAQSLNVKRGKHIIRRWNRKTFSGWLTDVPNFLAGLTEKIIFGFQQWGSVGRKFYVGINPIIHGYVGTTGWVLKPTLVIQWVAKDTEEDLSDITVGAGSPKKTIYMTSYGIKEGNTVWQEQTNPNDDDKPYLVYVDEETYDRTNFLQDLANFELNQNNKLQTEAIVSMLFDAYEYYNIKMSDRINISNTIQSNIYNNNNGFPLNISGVTFNFKNRTVTLNLTNYGKSYYAKTINFMSGYKSSSVKYAYVKEEVANFSQNV